MTASRLPLFPLPGVVLFPGTLLPLHIFEPRYRAMVSDALAGEKLIGMAMLDLSRGSAEPPPVFPVGGAGRIVEQERLDDGRFNIILEGVWRYRIVREESSAPYRTAAVEIAPVKAFPDPAREASAIRGARALFAAIQPEMDLPPLPSDEMSAERLSGELALRLRWPPSELQTLLETDSLPRRFRMISSRLSGWKETADVLRPYRGEPDPLNN